MKKYFLGLLVMGFLVFAGSVYALIQFFSGTGGVILSDGLFRTDGTGNAGLVTLDGSYRDDDLLGGEFWIQSVGTGSFVPGARIGYTGTGNPALDCWAVSGTAYARNIGVIQLNGPDTQLAYNPISLKLEGYGWNNGIGRVPFGAGDCADDDVVGGAGFIGKVKIIGNAGGNTILSTLYDQGPRFDVSIFNSLLQRVRKNVGVLSRNLSLGQRNETFTTNISTLNKLFYINNNSIVRTLRYQNIRSIYSTPEVQSLFIVGGDLYIDEDIHNTTGIPKGIIVLKNNNGVGGNVYINENVRNIQATIFTEGTLYSGESESTLYNSNSSNLTNLPSNQLYIEGSLISRNTIGGASLSKTQVVCPYNMNCTYESAIRYDLNYFRVYDMQDVGRAYRDASLDDYSVIIEYDSRVLSNPPPGFE